MDNLTKLNRKFDDKLKRKTWQLDNAAGFNRLADAVIVGEKERASGCFSAVVAPVLLIIAVAAMVFGGAHINPAIVKLDAESKRLQVEIAEEFKRDTTSREAARAAQAKLNAQTEQVQRMNAQRGQS